MFKLLFSYFSWKPLNITGYRYYHKLINSLLPYLAPRGNTPINGQDSGHMTQYSPGPPMGAGYSYQVPLRKWFNHNLYNTNLWNRVSTVYLSFLGFFHCPSYCVPLSVSLSLYSFLCLSLSLWLSFCLFFFVSLSLSISLIICMIVK